MHAVSYTLLYSTLSEAMSTLLDILFFLAFCTLFLVCQTSYCVHAMDGHAQHILTKWS